MWVTKSSGLKLDGRDDELSRGNCIRPGLPSHSHVLMAAFSFAVGIVLGIPILPQSQGPPSFTPFGQVDASSRSSQHRESHAGIPFSIEETRIKLLNGLRQKAIVNDSGKLLLLARELNAEPSSLTGTERVHKAAEIEKLAKSIKEKMSYAIGDVPSSPSTFTVVP